MSDRRPSAKTAGDVAMIVAFVVSYAARLRIGCAEMAHGPSAIPERRFPPCGNPRHLVVCLLVILAACEPYIYDADGYPVPYGGSASTTSSRPENCGTPGKAKRCPPYQLPSRKVSSAPLPDYNDRTY